MSGTHGDLFSEIGELVFAANAGQALDLEATSQELSERYAHLNVPPEAMARAIARSLGAVGVSMTLLNLPSHTEGPELRTMHPQPRRPADGGSPMGLQDGEEDGRLPSLFPSGVRLALLS